MKILGMGWPEAIIILLVILIIFGPKTLPKLGKAFGKTVKNIRAGVQEDETPEGEDSASAQQQGDKAVAVDVVSVETTPAALPEAAVSQQTGTGTDASPVVKKKVVRKKVV